MTTHLRLLSSFSRFDPFQHGDFRDFRFESISALPVSIGILALPRAGVCFTLSSSTRREVREAVQLPTEDQAAFCFDP